CELRDVLDIISLAWRYLMTDSDTRTANRWLAGVKRIFVEENICYVLDEQGGVHFAVDSEFEANRAATIGVLRAPRYANALSEFEAGFAALPDNAKGAVRGVFQAAEGLFRLMFPSAPRLGSKEIDKHLAPALQRTYTGDPTALGAASKLAASFGEWVDAAHFYRHEAGKEAVAQPPL